MKSFAASGLMMGLILASAVAQGATQGTVSQTCAVEVQKLCGDKTDVELRQCIRASEASLSPACKEALTAAQLKVKEIKPGQTQ